MLKELGEGASALSYLIVLFVVSFLIKGRISPFLFLKKKNYSSFIEITGYVEMKKMKSLDIGSQCIDKSDARPGRVR